MQDLRDRAGQVLRRFDFVEGVLPLYLNIGETDYGDTIHRLYEIITDDGRTLPHLSTGQRAQVAVSLLVAQNQAVADMLGHQVILLDDVTTAYDLSNLAREAILWRQLAYGKYQEKQEQYRRQIIISTHHEDMTNHLLDLLVPPPRRRMRVIRFVGWSNENGPECEAFEVQPSASVSRDTLARAMDDAVKDTA
jgi:hypothetical protein